MIYPFHTRGFLGRPLRLLSAAEGGPMKGNDVIALQTACQMPEGARDGIFGPKTAAELLLLQKDLGVKMDGVSGPGTEKAFCLQEIHRLDVGVPEGLPRGIVEGESGYRFGAQSPTYVRDSVLKADLGAVQFATPQADEVGARRALNPSQGISRLCQHLRSKRGDYLESTFVKGRSDKERLAGWLSCGSWNAPAWTDIWADRGPDDSRLQVIVTLQDGSKGTREQWVRNYVQSKIGYVESWEV